MSTSELNRGCAKTAFAYALVSGFCAVFGMIYEHFSHGVWSPDMVYAFGYPLLGGVIPFLALALFAKKAPGYGPGLIYHCGIATLTLGSILKGVLEIYGTANALTACYDWAGWGLTAAGLILWFFEKYREKSC